MGKSIALSPLRLCLMLALFFFLTEKLAAELDLYSSNFYPYRFDWKSNYTTFPWIPYEGTQTFNSDQHLCSALSRGDFDQVYLRSFSFMARFDDRGIGNQLLV